MAVSIKNSGFKDSRRWASKRAARAHAPRRRALEGTQRADPGMHRHFNPHNPSRSSWSVAAGWASSKAAAVTIQPLVQPLVQALAPRRQTTAEAGAALAKFIAKGVQPWRLYIDSRAGRLAVQTQGIWGSQFVSWGSANTKHSQLQRPLFLILMFPAISQTFCRPSIIEDHRSFIRNIPIQLHAPQETGRTPAEILSTPDP